MFMKTQKLEEGTGLQERPGPCACRSVWTAALAALLGARVAWKLAFLVLSSLVCKCENNKAVLSEGR